MKYSEKVKKYSTAFPDEIKRAIEGLDNEVRYAIVSFLLERGEASFTEIVEELGIDNRSFSNHVKKLIAGGLVQNFVRRGEIREKHSYYRITPYGYIFLKSLFKSLEPAGVEIWLPAEPKYSVRFTAKFDYTNIDVSESEVFRSEVEQKEQNQKVEV